MQGSQHAFDEALAPPPMMEEPLFVEPDPNPDQDEETSMALPPTSSETMPHGVQRLQRVQVPTQKWLESEEQKDFDLSIAYLTYYDVLHEDEYVPQEDMQQPLAYLSQADPDTMQYHQAMKEPVRAQFIEAIVHE
eukprot:11618352-Ditylum_brightwellii.AAC.1